MERGLRSSSSSTETEDESETGSLVLLASHQAETMEKTKGKRNPWQGAEQSPAVWAKPRAGLFFFPSKHTLPHPKKNIYIHTSNGIVRSESQLDVVRDWQAGEARGRLSAQLGGMPCSAPPQGQDQPCPPQGQLQGEYLDAFGSLCTNCGALIFLY